MSVLEAAHLKDLLRVRDNGGDGRDALAGLTLAAVLGGETQATNPRGPSRTLLDIIKEEETGAAYKGLAPPGQGPKDKHSWKSFKNRIRRRTISPSSHAVDAYDFSVDDVNLRISNPTLLWRRNPALMGPPIGNPSMGSPRIGAVAVDATSGGSPGGNSSNPILVGAEELRPAIEEMSLDSMDGIEQPRARRATGLTRIPSLSEQRAEIEMELEQPRHGRETGDLAEERAETETETALDSADNVPTQETRPMTVGAVVAQEDTGPPRVSLMALLGETDWNSETADSIEADEVEDELEEEAQAEDDGIEENGEAVCCVCMVRHKGAAFIPCGHTFCRLCSRELWVNRGNCPLCNNYILEILDIF